MRVSFNPGSNPDVDEIKAKAAELIDLVLKAGKDPRCTAIAATHFEEGAMMAVKSATAESADSGKSWTPPMGGASSRMKIEIYTTPTCQFSLAAKQFMKDHKIDWFIEHDVSKNEAKKKEMIERSGQMGVPVIIANDEVVVGFDAVQLKKVLNIRD